MIRTASINPQRNNRSRRRGSALVEFALISGLFLLLLMGIIQYGIYINATTAVVSLSREAARYCAVTPGATADSVKNYITTAGVLPPQLLASAVGNVSVDYYDATGTTKNGLRSSGNMTKVSVTYDMTSKFFLPKSFAGPVLKDSYVCVTSFRVENP